INIIYPVGHEFPKKPSKVMMHNSNLMYAIYPIQVNEQELMETFFVNSLWKDHQVNQASKDHYFTIDGNRKFKITDALSEHKQRCNPDTIYARYNTEVGKDNLIPLWLLGFLY
ncbi:MAG: ATP-binding protein, partial [Prevotella sp.]|nr:ATP-binding protein [Prevotella sp.]